MRKLSILALSLLSLAGLTDAATARSLSLRTVDRLAAFEATCDDNYGDLTLLHTKAICELPNGRVLTLRLTRPVYDYAPAYDYAPRPSINIILGDHHHHCRPEKVEAMTLGMGGDCRSGKPPVMSKPIEMGSGSLKGLNRH